MKEFKRSNVAFSVEWVGVKTDKKKPVLSSSSRRGSSDWQRLAAAPVASKVATKPTARPDRFTAWLAGQGENLQLAYAGLIGSDKANSNSLAPNVAQAIVKHVAGKPDREKALFATRHQIGITKEAVKNRAGFSYKKLVKVFGREFK